MKIEKNLMLVLGMLALLSQGCKKHESNNKDTAPASFFPSGEIVNMTGSFDGSFRGTTHILVTNMALTLVQNGVNLSGTFLLAPSNTGTISGAINQDTMKLTLTQTNPCAGTYQVVAPADEFSIIGTLVGSDCAFTENGTFNVARKS